MKFTTILGLILIVFSAQVLAQTTPASKPRTRIVKVDKDLTKIFGEKKEKKVNKKEKKNIPNKEAPKPVTSVPPTVEIKPLNTGLLESSMPKNYTKRSEAVFNIGLIYYGELYTEAEFEKIQNMLETRFTDATRGLLKLNVVFSAILPYEHPISLYPDYKKHYYLQKEPEVITAPITDIGRLQRIWYYDNKGMRVAEEVYKNAKSHNLYGKDFSKIDALAVVTGAQFEGIGFASGRVAVTENPMEIAWEQPSGRTEIQSNPQVVDELIHELGHTLYLDHAADQCFQNGMSYEDTQACCAASENKNDVLSYCRKRNDVDENFFFGFEECNLKRIKDRVIPAMLSGGEWELKNMEKCI